MRTEALSVCVQPTAKICEVMERINQSHKGIALVVDSNRRLLGTVTDGDIRRGLLRGLTLEAPIHEVMNKDPFVAPDSLSDVAFLRLMKANAVRQLPIVDEDGCVVALEFVNIDSERESELMTAVVMAGGKGERLRPLTDSLPKPMLPVSGRPILEILLESLKRVGFRRVLISLGYLGGRIQTHFGDGSGFGLEVHYIREKEPLGTGGALGMIPEELRPLTPFLVVNGDLLTRLNFLSFRDFHIAAGYEFTLGCRPYEVNVPFGFPVIEGDVVTGFREKPTFNYLVNSGIYCLSPELFSEIPSETYLNITDLIKSLCKRSRRVGVFPLREAFHEVGRLESYRAAEAFYQEHLKPEPGHAE